MANSVRRSGKSGRETGRMKRPTKKDQILSLFTSGIDEIEDLAMITATRPSYVASILQDAGLIEGYFDLYTTSAHPMNVYSKFFANRLGFRSEETARESVGLVDHLYRQFGTAGDRAGQHHALLMGLTMFNRARWTGKDREAAVFRDWLQARLAESVVPDEDLSAEDAEDGEDTVDQ